MITANSTLLAFLANPPGNLIYEDLYTITLSSGQIVRLCSGGRDITIGGHTFTSFAPAAYISKARVKTGIGLRVDSTDVTIIADADEQPISGIPMLAEFGQGYFDNATVLVERLFMPTRGDISLGTYIHFLGNFGEITELDYTQCRFSVNSKLELLNQSLPRNIYTPACRHALYDAGCLLTRSSFGVAGSALSGSNRSAIVATLSQAATSAAPTAPSLSVLSPSGVNLNLRSEFVVITYVYPNGESLGSPETNISLANNQVARVHSPGSSTGAVGWNCYIGNSPGNEMLQNGTPIAIGTDFDEGIIGPVQGSPPPNVDTSGYFALGVIEFTSGANAGLSRSVSTYVDGPSSNKTLNIVPPLPVAPSPGNTFTVYPGCDKRLSTCGAKFNNLIHFGGQPWIPEPTTVL